MFLQIHTLTSYPATLLNRDDAGLAKRITFGDDLRLRISSQCLKRHWRVSMQDSLPLPFGLRTRRFFSREICRRLIDEKGLSVEQAVLLAKTLMSLLLPPSEKAKAEKTRRATRGKRAAAGAPDPTAGDAPDMDAAEAADSTAPPQTAAPDPDDPTLMTNQVILFGKPEADYLVNLLADCASKGEGAVRALTDILTSKKANFSAMLRQAGHGNLYAGVEGAMFGRFVTSSILARTDAPVHVLHAHTVHGQAQEIDFFTAVDDLNREDETGSALADDMELGAGVYYGYINVDIPLLVSNFTGCDPQAWRSQESAEVRQTLATLIRTIATVSPGAKRGATAPYAYSDFVLLEAGRQQPRCLSNAFLQALRPRGNLTAQAVVALGDYLRKQEGMFGPTADHRALATTCAWSGAPTPQPLPGAVDETLARLFDQD